MAKLKTSGGFGELGRFLVENGHNVPDEIIREHEEEKKSEEDLFDVLFDAKNEKIESDDIEREAEDIINEAEEVLEEVAGVPGVKNNEGEALEPSSAIVDVATETVQDDGIVSTEDIEGKREDLIKVIEEEEKLDDKLNELEESGATESTLERVKKTKSFLLGEADKIIREMSPELFARINKEDYKIIKKVEDLFDSINDKRKVPITLGNGKPKNIKINKTKKIKLAELIRGNKITDDEAHFYLEAEERRGDFTRQASIEGIKEDTARAIYRTHIDFINELRESEPGDFTLGKKESEQKDEEYAVHSVKNEEILEDVPVPESEEEKEKGVEEEAEENSEEGKQDEPSTSKETEEDRPVRSREKINSLNEFQLKKYEELATLYEECAQKTALIKDEKDRDEAKHFLTNLKKEIDGMSYHKGNYADNLIIAHKFATHDQIRKLNYILEQEAPIQEKVSDGKSKLFELSNSLKRLIGRLSDRNERNELLASVDRLENRISEISDEENEENESKLLSLNEYAISLKLDIDSAFGIKKKQEQSPSIDNLERDIIKDPLILGEVPIPDSSEIAVTPTPESNEVENLSNEDFEKQTEDLEKKVSEIAKESKENNLSDFERKIEKLRDTVVRCTELASTIRDVDTKRDIMSAINKLISQVENVYENEGLNEKQKSSKIHENLKKLLSDIDKAHKPKGKSDVSVIGKKDAVAQKFEDKIETKPGKNREAKPISEKVYSEYEKVGVGLDTLKELEGFRELTAGQQILMLKNYNSVLFDKMRIDTKKEIAAEWAKKSFSGKVGHVGLSIITLGTANTFKEKRKQKEIAARLLAGGHLGFENRKTLLQSLVSVAKESPSVHIDRDGELQIEYIDSEKFDNDPEAHDIISAYNEAASRYASIPRSWFDNNIDFNGKTEELSFYSKMLGTKHAFLSGKERSVMADAKDEYEEAREEYLNLMLEQNGDTLENRRLAMKELNLLDERVKMNQLFISDPNAEALLQESKDASVFNSAMSEFMSKRGQYMAYGILTRIAAVATVTSIAAPVGLAVVAGMGYLRGKRDVRDMLKMRRVSGALSERELREEIVYNVDLHESLGNLTTALNHSKGRGDREEEVRIAERIDEVKEKINSGHNFERRTRKLGEFREAKFFSERVENLVTKYELLKDTPGQEKEADLIELKIAQTSTLMRELMNNNMLRFGEKGDDSKSVINRLSFIQALSLADTTISLDTNTIEKKIANIVGQRREDLDDLENSRSIKHCRKAVTIAAGFGSAGYALAYAGGEFFGNGGHTPEVESDAIPASKPEGVIRFKNEDIAEGGGSIKDTLKEGMEKVAGIFNREQVDLPEGMYSVHEGESLSSIIIAHNKDLLEISPNAQNNAITNFLNHLDVAKLKEIGLSSNPAKITSGQQIDIAKLEEYFGSMRVGGKSFVERALQVTGEKSGEVPFINEGLTSTEVPKSVVPETITDQEATAPLEVNTGNESYFGSLEDLENAWPTLSVAEKAASWNFIIPEYIARHIGPANDEFIAMADKIDASELSDYMDNGNVSNSDSKGQMLKAVADALKSRGITPDEGYDYNGKNLHDYVSQVYRSKIMTKGLDSIR